MIHTSQSAALVLTNFTLKRKRISKRSSLFGYAYLLPKIAFPLCPHL